MSRWMSLWESKRLAKKSPGTPKSRPPGLPVLRIQWSASSTGPMRGLMPASAPETQFGGSEATARELIPFCFVPIAEDRKAALADRELQYQRDQLAAPCADALA